MAMTNAERQAAWKARHGKPVSLVLPEEIKAGLDAYIERQRQHGNNTTANNVIAHLVRTQLLRKR